jgi:hypothetical protein
MACAGGHLVEKQVKRIYCCLECVQGKGNRAPAFFFHYEQAPTFQSVNLYVLTMNCQLNLWSI